MNEWHNFNHYLSLIITHSLTHLLLYLLSNYPSISPSVGIITTIAGTGSTTYSGDNDQATSAALYFPFGVTVDTAGTNYISTY